MPPDSEVWQALLRAKGLTVAELAAEMRTTRQHAHRLLTGKRSAEAKREELDRALALGPRRDEGRPLYAIAVLTRDGDLELLPAGDVQPLFADRERAVTVGEALADLDGNTCVVPVWPEHAWRRTVAFHAAWGSAAEPRNVFLVDDPESGLPWWKNIADELTSGFRETLRLRASADDPARLQEIETLLDRASSRNTAQEAGWRHTSP